MDTPLARLLRLLRVLLELVWNLLLGWLLSFFRALPLLKAIVRRRIGRERPRGDSARRCMPVFEKVNRRPDPLIYSQSYLMAQGLAVTWDTTACKSSSSGRATPTRSTTSGRPTPTSSRSAALGVRGQPSLLVL